MKSEFISSKSKFQPVLVYLTLETEFSTWKTK